MDKKGFNWKALGFSIISFIFVYFFLINRIKDEQLNPAHLIQPQIFIFIISLIIGFLVYLFYRKKDISKMYTIKSETPFSSDSLLFGAFGHIASIVLLVLSSLLFMMGVIGGIIFKRFDMFILLAFFSSLGFALVYYVHKGKK